MELTDTHDDFEQIVELQRMNHISIVESGKWETEGFVTLEFDAGKLAQMKGAYKHVVAKSKNKVIGYALVLLREQGSNFPFLDDMFKEIDAAVFKGMSVKAQKYFVMGQICVESKFRKQGVFSGLYHKLREQMQPDFDFVVTEVSKKNARSVNAHKRIGFRDINDTVNAHASQEWEVIAWDWK